MDRRIRKFGTTPDEQGYWPHCLEFAFFMQDSPSIKQGGRTLNISQLFWGILSFTARTGPKHHDSALGRPPPKGSTTSSRTDRGTYVLGAGMTFCDDTCLICGEVFDLESISKQGEDRTLSRGIYTEAGACEGTTPCAHCRTTLFSFR